jgi:putative transposase
MPRSARGLVGNSYYHVINRGNGQQRIFHKDSDFAVLISLFEDAREKYSVKVYAYCLMPDHFHLLVKPAIAGDLSRWMQWLMTSHVRRYHRRYGTSGHIWQGRFKCFIVKEDEHLLAVTRYIEGNPVRSGMVESALEWRWSSHAVRVTTFGVLPVDSLPLDLPDSWTEYVDMPLMDHELDKIRHSVNRQAPYGDSSWQLEKCSELGLESTLKPLGRPRKKKKVS